MKRNFFIYLLIFIVIILAGTCIFLFYKYETKKCVTIKNEVKDILNPNYVFLGDSITALYDLNKYYDGLPVVNSGISGETTDDIVNNLQDRVYKYNPSKVIILIGINDIERKISKEKTIENINKIVTQIKDNKPDCEIYLESIYPINNSNEEKINHSMVGIRTNDQVKSLNEDLVKLSKKKKINYIDLYDKLLDKNGNLKIEYTKEGLHMSDEGYEIITKYIKKYVLNQ